MIEKTKELAAICTAVVLSCVVCIGISALGLFYMPMALAAFVLVPLSARRDVFIANLSLIHIFIPQIIKALSWQSVFLVCGSFSAAAAAVWAVGYGMIARKKTENNVSCPDISNTEYNENSSDKVKLFPVLVSSGVIFVLIGIISQGFLRDGITTWFPSYVSQTFSLPAENSIFITAALFVTAIVGVYLTKWLYRRFFRNERCV